MTLDRTDILWAGVRLFGVYFLAKSIEASISFANHAVTLLRYGDPLSSDSPDTAFALASLQLSAERGMVSSAIWASLSLAAAFYFLRRGEAVFRLVARPENPASDQGVEPDVE